MIKTPSKSYRAAAAFAVSASASALNLFGTSNSATFTFQAPTNVSTTSPISVAITGALTASTLGNAFAFTGASLQAVPEPGPTAMLCLGALGTASVAFRRRIV